MISDAMEAPGPSGRPGAPVSAIAAGVDVLLYTSERTSGGGYDELVAAAANGTLPVGRAEKLGGADRGPQALARAGLSSGTGPAAIRRLERG